jgi:hypothetical protein
MNLRYKIVYTILFILIAQLGFAQIAIGKSSVDGNSTLLDFDNSNTNTMGIILPAVENSPAGLSVENNGTFLYDRSLGKVRMFENNEWKDLTDEGDTSLLQINSSIENAENQGVIIGSDTTEAVGILVLESEDQALILPKIERPHENVKSPYPGMMCYDIESKSLAVFDGENWSYWK